MKGWEHGQVDEGAQMTRQTLILTESMPETEPGETKDKGQRGQQRYRQGHRRKKKTGTEEESR